MYYSLLFAASLLSLCMIWLPAYFVTIDGPVHMHNAMIIRDMLCGEEFYNAFYTFNTHPNANWLVHLVMMCLLFVFKAATAEKIIITVYALLFVSGFAKLFQQLKVSSWFVLVVFLFLLNKPLFNGFYGFSLSVALIPWLIYFSLTWKENHTVKRSVLLCLMYFIAYLLHPIGYLTSVAISFVLITYSVDARWWFLLRSTSAIYFLGLQSLFLIALLWFAGQHHADPFRFYFNRSFIVDQFLPFTSFTINDHTEKLLGWCAGILLCSLFLYILLHRWVIQRKRQVFDALLPIIGMMLFVYLFFPDSFLFQLMERRIQLVLYLVFFIGIAMYLKQEILIKVFSISCVFLFFTLSVIRWNALFDRGEQVKQFSNFLKHIPAQSTVIGLQANHQNLFQQRSSSQETMPFFLHAHSYGLLDRQVFILDNYEASLGWFPLQFKPEIDPYTWLNRTGSLESENPQLNIPAFSELTHLPIHYVLLGGLTASRQQDANWQYTLRCLQTQYTIIHQDQEHGFLLMGLTR